MTIRESVYLGWVSLRTNLTIYWPLRKAARIRNTFGKSCYKLPRLRTEDWITYFF